MPIRIGRGLGRLSSQLLRRYCTGSDEKTCQASFGKRHVTDGICRKAPLLVEARRTSCLAPQIIIRPSVFRERFFAVEPAQPRMAAAPYRQVLSTTACRSLDCGGLAAAFSM